MLVLVLVLVLVSVSVSVCTVRGTRTFVAAEERSARVLRRLVGFFLGLWPLPAAEWFEDWLEDPEDWPEDPAVPGSAQATA
ncbi:hypothetical protein [[Mycobacterium] fortunisiensis]|uniref:hypothetical protein n=1 Tax=[Mycobacterium] fortunisiensis TaxID=2600579 RepID=UPI0027E17F85|nr:hypothetical protein [[Mycobacterium] fortunisiensis]